MSTNNMKRASIALGLVLLTTLTLTACDKEKSDPLCWLADDPIGCLVVTGQ